MRLYSIIGFAVLFTGPLSSLFAQMPLRDPTPAGSSSVVPQALPLSPPQFGNLPPSIPGATSPTEPLGSADGVKIRFHQIVREKQNRLVNGSFHEVEVVSFEPREITIPKDVDLKEYLERTDVPADGKRLAVLTICAQRHDKLLQALVEAKSDEDKKKASQALQENYLAHYSIESWWRREKLKDLETRLEEMRAQVKQREDAAEKYVEAAMTMANLHAQGISYAPPRPAPPDPQTNGTSGSILNDANKRSPGNPFGP